MIMLKLISAPVYKDYKMVSWIKLKMENWAD
jgi:hypothetical protein